MQMMIKILNKILNKFGYKIFSLYEYNDIIEYYNEQLDLAKLEYIDSLEKNKNKFYGVQEN